MSTEPKYEINHEKLSAMSVADLTGIIVLASTRTAYCKKLIPYLSVFEVELDKRINDIIIF